MRHASDTATASPPPATGRQSATSADGFHDHLHGFLQSYLAANPSWRAFSVRVAKELLGCGIMIVSGVILTALWLVAFLPQIILMVCRPVLRSVTQPGRFVDALSKIDPHRN